MDSWDDLFTTIQPDVKAHLTLEVPDVIPLTLAERLRAAVEQQYGPLPPAPPVTGRTIRLNCRFCGGRGCLNCDTLAEQEYRRQFPDRPQPLATFRRDDPADMARAKEVIEGIMQGAQRAIDEARRRGEDDI